MGWNSYPTSGIITISDGNGTELNIFNSYGKLSTSEITLNATTYVNADTRKTQNNNQIYHCLKNLLTASGIANIISKSTKYNIRSNPCGALLLRIILHKSIIYARAKAFTIRDNLSIIDTYFATVNYDIEKFNEYINTNHEALNARGERCDGMMSNLFK